MGSHQEAGNSIIDALDAAVDTATQAFQGQTDNMMEQFNELAEELESKLETLGEECVDVADQAKTGADELVDNLTSEAGDIATQITEKLLEEIFGEVGDLASGLTDALGFLSDAGEESGGLLDGALGDVFGSASEITDLIEDIKPVLDLIESALG
jgi:ElaB/YqjD/DUF883 family membrane-anchored ribosome-binding protein